VGAAISADIEFNPLEWAETRIMRRHALCEAFYGREKSSILRIGRCRNRRSFRGITSTESFAPHARSRLDHVLMQKHMPCISILMATRMRATKTKSRPSIKTKPTSSLRKALANHEIVVLATYLAGGKSIYTDTEDIAFKANEIAPGRFTWRKYNEQINIETVRKRLWDATKREKGGYLIGSERDGWLLTQTGLKFCRKHIALLTVSKGSSTRRSQRERTWLSRERVRMLAESAYQKFAAGQMKSITPVEAERFFHVDDYVVGAARKTKIERSIAAFAADPLLGEATKQVAEFVRSK
jgi:hypothetical protein